MSFTNLAVVAAVAFAAPLALGLVPWLRLPAVVLEIVLGIVVGPQVLGWAEVDGPVQVMNLIGLAFLLLIAGLEVDFDRLRGRLLRVSGLGFVASFAIALVVGLALHEGGFVRSPLLVAIMLSATSLGVVIPVLKDGGRADSPFGQLTIAGASIADIATVVLLSLFFSGESSGAGAKVVLLGGFAALVAAVGLSILGAQRSMRISAALVRLQDTTAQIRVRGAPALLYRGLVSGAETAAAGLLQATSLGFFVVAGQIGMQLGLISAANGAALVAAGLLSVLLFPLGALTILRREDAPARAAAQPQLVR